ncbi:glycoside hydrolase family 30 protein [Spirosoma arcticum]
MIQPAKHTPLRLLPVRQSGLPALLITIGLLVSCQKSTNTQTGPVQLPIAKSDVALWLTTPDRTALFARQGIRLVFSTTSSAGITIDVDTTQTFQTMDGFGYTMTGGSALLINRMNPTDRAALLEELFGTDGNHIGISYLRISIGASDLSDRVFTYNDLPTGETDPTMAKFSLAPERADLLPVLKQILAINPAIKIMGSPWTPPVWMKTNGNAKGGSLKPEFYDAYARYFIRYVQEMKAGGIPIDAITIQNEPLHPGNNPSLLMLPAEQALFIKQHLGPAFRSANIQTKIILYDHNADRPDYPISILNDPAAKPYVDGSAFHLYGGTIDALEQVHQAHPDKHLYFTEQWVSSKGAFNGDLTWHTKNLMIGAPRNWCRTVLEWNLAADPDQNPHTDGGCTECLGALTISADGTSVTRNVAYYLIAHASKFVRPGSVRVASNQPAGLPNVAYRTPTGQKVLLVQNEGTSARTFAIRYRGGSVTATLTPGAVGTFVW